MKKILILILVSLCSVYALAPTNKTDKKIATKTPETRLEALNRFSRIISHVEQYYVDEIAIEEIVNKAIDGLLTNLDAHSSYLTKSAFSEMKVQTNGEFGGIGINIGMRDGALTIIAPIEGTPGDKAGLQAQDIILKINEHSTINMSMDEAIGLMRGKPRTPVTLTIIRKSSDKPVVVDIVRDIITIDSVYTKLIEDEDILYIRIVKFDKKVSDEMLEALKKHEKNIKGVILDMRNNPGGLLDQAISVVDLFVDKGVIVSQKGRVAGEDTSFNATKANTFKDVPLTVLINTGSASASEIVSGALQDHKRAIVIGEKSFGKGSVQVILPVTNDEAMRLTIARYYLPNDRTIQAKGVDPDIVIPAGEVPKEADNALVVKEAQLKQHLTEKLDTIEASQEKKDDKKGDKKGDKKTKEAKSKSDAKIITKEDIQKDIRLKTAIDTIKTIRIIQNK